MRPPRRPSAGTARGGHEYQSRARRLSTPHNLITDVAGIRVGNAHDPHLASGVTAIVIDRRNVASGVTRGGAPGTRDTALPSSPR